MATPAPSPFPAPGQAHAPAQAPHVPAAGTPRVPVVAPPECVCSGRRGSCSNPPNVVLNHSQRSLSRIAMTYGVAIREQRLVSLNQSPDQVFALESVGWEQFFLACRA